MSNAADALVADARSHLGEARTNQDCANFVSQVYKEAGHGSVFGSSNRVATIVSKFPADRIQNTDLNSIGDLVVFGDDEHIMIFSDARDGKCVGTASTHDEDLRGVSVVREVFIRSIGTKKYPTACPVKYLVTALSPSPELGLPLLTDPGKALSDTAAQVAPELFGTLFGWVPGFALNAGVLLIAAGLVYVGAKQVVGAGEDTV